MATFVPTTIIGLGTSGCRALAWLSRLLYQEFGDEVPPFIRMVALDTAEDSLGTEQFAEAIEVRPLHPDASLSVVWERLQASGIAEWFPAEARKRVETLDTTKGAGNVRAVGRMCFWSRIPEGIFADVVAEGSRQPYSINNRQAAARLLTEKLGVTVLPEVPGDKPKTPNTHYIKKDEHQYYIIGSATGGTASGSIVDLAHLAASTRVENKAPTVVVLLTLPPETMQGAQGLGVNAAATLIDLADMVLRPESITRTVHKYPNGRPPTSRGESPASAVYFVGPSAPGSRGAQMVFNCSEARDVQEGLAMISAYWLYASLFGLGADLHQRISDYPQFLRNLGDTRPWPEQSAAFRTFALGGAARPTWLLAELVTKRLLDQQILKWTDAEAARSDAWRRSGREWMGKEIDKEVGGFATGIDKREMNTRASEERNTGSPQHIVDVFHSDPQGRHAFASGQAREGAARLRDLLMHKVGEVINNEHSLLAGTNFLAGAEEVLNGRAAEWESLGVDCSGRVATQDAAMRIIDKKAAAYHGTPPWWLGGPHREEVMREMSADFASWIAAHYLAPHLFAPAAAAGNQSVLAAASSQAVALRAQRDALESLRGAWERREQGIVNIDTHARGTITLVWFEEGDQPAVAADKVVAKIGAEGGLDAPMRDALSDLAGFLALPSVKQQEEQLLSVWTGNVVLPKTRAIVRDVSLSQTMAANAEVRTLLCLNRDFSSRKYFSPVPGTAFEASPSAYHITSADRPTGHYHHVQGGHLDLLKDLDLKYAEAVGFTLYDIEHFRTWLGRLLAAPTALAETDPYQGVREYLNAYVETVVRFIRDVLVNWDDATEAPVGIWAIVQQPPGAPLLRIVSGATGPDVAVYLGGETFSVGSQWKETCRTLAENPTRFQALVEAVQRALNRADPDSLRQRWAVVEPAIPRRYPAMNVDVGKLAIQYGVTAPTGDIAHLHRHY